ncbi:MAG TPA: hypothetical protein PKA95_12705 [Thermomicrobiales bacterium]|nr:hypothetical protein [Thermomicrobiales bacterium]
MDGADGGDLVDGREAGEVGDIERPEGVLALGTDAERRAAGGEDRQTGNGGHEVGESRRGVEDLLEVVEDEEPGLAGDLAGH